MNKIRVRGTDLQITEASLLIVIQACLLTVSDPTMNHSISGIMRKQDSLLRMILTIAQSMTLFRKNDKAQLNVRASRDLGLPKVTGLSNPRQVTLKYPTRCLTQEAKSAIWKVRVNKEQTAPVTLVTNVTLLDLWVIIHCFLSNRARYWNSKISTLVWFIKCNKKQSWM